MWGTKPHENQVTGAKGQLSRFHIRTSPLRAKRIPETWHLKHGSDGRLSNCAPETNYLHYGLNVQLVTRHR